MSGILEHKWGVSDAADRVWAHVIGLRPAEANGRRLMALQAFMDESETEGGFFVLGGIIAPPEQWARFSSDWEAMLRHATLDENGERHFKMAAMTAEPERLERIVWFKRIADKYALFFISCTVFVPDLKAAGDRIDVGRVIVDWHHYANPYLFCLRALMDAFHIRREQLDTALPPGEKVDFIFDNRSEKKIIRDLWDSYLSVHSPEIRSRFGADPSFRNDKEFLPLQAADLWVGLLRKKYESRGEFKLPIESFMEKKPWLCMTMSQDDIVLWFGNMVKPHLPPGYPVRDRKTNQLIGDMPGLQITDKRGKS